MLRREPHDARRARRLPLDLARRKRKQPKGAEVVEVGGLGSEAGTCATAVDKGGSSYVKVSVGASVASAGASERAVLVTRPTVSPPARARPVPTHLVPSTILVAAGLSSHE